jgi:hypothetical protein
LAAHKRTRTQHRMTQAEQFALAGEEITCLKTMWPCTPRT